ncbi:MAG: glutamate racemase [Saprospiraceae bacterium]|nr:glutamate racemase [Saprospiraceae bacterium]
MVKTKNAIGIFDSGYGGLTVFRAIKDLLPQYDYLYLGDNARAPYGNRSFDVVYKYTLECVEWFFRQGCPLVILACNTASAKALRTIQQKDLVDRYPEKRVLGVIRPTAEIIGTFSQSGVIGILGTMGTISSHSYEIEIEHFAPEIKVVQHACPMWVPLIENGEYHGREMDAFIESDLKQLFRQDPGIDTILLACTHYPLIADKIERHLPAGVRLISQGAIVANSLKDYLNRHPEIESQLSANGETQFCTTDDAAFFMSRGREFFGEYIEAMKVHL